MATVVSGQSARTTDSQSNVKPKNLLEFSGKTDDNDGAPPHGSTPANESPPVNPEAEAHLEQTLTTVREAVDAALTGASSPDIVRRLSFLRQAIDSLLSKPADVFDWPVGSHAHERNLVVNLKTESSRKKQDEAVEFIIARYIQKGAKDPVTSREIIDGTSLASEGNVRRVLSQLVAEGQVLVFNERGRRGYVPSERLFRRRNQEINLIVR